MEEVNGIEERLCKPAFKNRVVYSVTVSDITETKEDHVPIPLSKLVYRISTFQAKRYTSTGYYTILTLIR